MKDLLTSKIIQGVVLAAVTGLVGALLGGFLTLPKTVSALETQAAYAKEKVEKLDGRVTTIEKDYVGERKFEGTMGAMDKRFERLEDNMDRFVDFMDKKFERLLQRKRLPEDE